MDVDGIFQETFGPENALADVASPGNSVRSSITTSMRSELLPDGLQDSFAEYERFSALSTSYLSEISEVPLTVDLGDPSATVFNVCVVDAANASSITSSRLSRSPRKPSSSYAAAPKHGFMLEDLVSEASFEVDPEIYTDGADLLNVELSPMSEQSSASLIPLYADELPSPLALAASSSAESCTYNSAASALLQSLHLVNSKPVTSVSLTDSVQSAIPSPDSTVGSSAAASVATSRSGTFQRGKTLSDFNNTAEYVAYQDRRRKNNTASRRSRHKNKQRVKETEDEVQELRQENADLRKQLRIITEAFENLRERFKEQPPVMQDGSSDV
ncbi:transcription factor atf-2-like [Sycon ciliatum]|uniref:transcription factor atf-2-like n=1 Tax=Sycon ciliatum TaxID=27933 RepID=UPI0031F6E325